MNRYHSVLGVLCLGKIPVVHSWFEEGVKGSHTSIGTDDRIDRKDAKDFFGLHIKASIDPTDDFERLWDKFACFLNEELEVIEGPNVVMGLP